MEQRYREIIAKEFKNCVNNTIMRMKDEATYRPFHTALLSEEVILWSRFERSFSTSFGQRVIEEVARLVALSNGASQVEKQKETNFNLDDVYVTEISRHIQSLRNGQIFKWNSTIAMLSSLKLSGKTTPVRVISDLWWKKDGIDNFISLKTVKPNIDQTAIAKEDCLKLKMAYPNCNVYFGLPYNPYGERKRDYAHNPPMKIFDFHNDPVVLIGKELWDTVGGDGCYEELLDIVSSVGAETKQAISRAFCVR